MKNDVKKPKQKLMKFEVLEGTHQQCVFREVTNTDDRGAKSVQCTKRYDLTWLKGEVIASADPLDRLFRGKFKRVPDEVPASKGHMDYRYPVEGQEDYPKNPNLREYGDLEETEVEDEEGEVDEDLLPEPVVAKPAKSAKAVGKAPSNAFFKGAKDVTAKFPFVTEEAEGLRVLRNGEQFAVVSEDNPQQPLNGNPLSKKEVQPFVERYLDE